jgi:hypothetical protein
MTLFNSRAASMVVGSALMAKWNADQERQAESQNRFDIYSDDYEEIIRAKVKELFCKKNYNRLYYHVNQSQNILKRVINEISTVYKVPAQRTLNKASDRYDQLQAEVGLDARLKKVNRLTNLLNEMIVVVAIRDEKMVLDIVSPAYCTVIQNEDDPTKMDGFMYMRTLVNTPTEFVVEYPYWDNDGHYQILDQDLRVKEELYTPTDYPYKDKQGRFVIPAVPFHRQHPEDCFWDQDSGRDLYNAALMMGVKMTLFDYYYKTGTIKQLYAIGEGIDIPNEQVADPLTMIVARSSAQGNAQIGVLDMQLNLDQLIASLTYQLNSVINNYGISADMWSMSISEMSGRALKIRNRALLESRQEQQETYREGETELFDTMRIVNNAHAGYFGWQKIPEDATFAVDFGEIDFPEDPNYEIDLEAKRLKSGLISLGQFYMKFNPDIEDEKAAEAAILDNLNKLKATRDANPTLDEALNYIMQGNLAKPNQTGAVGNPVDTALAQSKQGNA